MKKCLKCEVVFHLNERTRCLYCNSLLLSASEQDEEKFKAKKVKRKKKAENAEGVRNIFFQAINERKVIELGHIEYIVACYFKRQSLKFMYTFWRQDFKKGRDFKRFMVQPLNLSSFLIIPWVFINFIDSIFMRLMYNGFCQKCGCKFVKGFSGNIHEENECIYNVEYDSIINDIALGNITDTERIYKEQAATKTTEGKRSAYYKLCYGKKRYSSFVDVICIWFSISLIFLGVSLAAFPLIKIVLKRIGDSELYLR